MNNIKQVVQKNLCIECGICKSICQYKCINIVRNGYNYNPQINNECINCGLCLKTCPINNITDYDNLKDIKDNILGNYYQILCAKTKDNFILENAASGGVITQIITELLKKDKYDCAFLVDGYNYDEQLKTKYFDKNSNFISTQKSRYLTICHSDSCKYILNNPNKKVIFVATGCVISAILNFIKLKKLNRDNYLLLGLFCDKTMNYGVVEYFKQHPVSKNKEIKNLFFKTKKAGGWPGNVRIEYKNGIYIDLPSTVRSEVKDFFILERCLYCLDKLNKNADISFGDNYIPMYNDPKGASSIVIRTDIGQQVFSELSSHFEIEQNSEKELVESQHLYDKLLNLEFSKIKGLRKGNVKLKIIKKYNNILRKIEISRLQNSYNNIQEYISNEKYLMNKKKSNLFRKILKNIFSVKNSKNKMHKEIMLLGIKINIRVN